MSAADEDKLTPEEREVRDKQAREREAQEQAQLPYRWKQTLAEVDVQVPIPKGTRSKQLTVVIEQKRLKVALKATPDAPIMDVGGTKVVSGVLCGVL